MKENNRKRDVKTLWDHEGEKVQSGENDLNSAAALIDNMEEYVRFRTDTEMRHLFSKYNFTGKQVLDIGCGPGRLSFIFAAKSAFVYGIDFSKGFIEMAREQQLKKKVVNVQFENIALEDFVVEKKFDTVFIGGVLMYMTDEEILKELKELKQKFLTPGADILIREPISYLGEAQYTELDVKRTPAQYISLFKQAGFNLTYTNETFMHSPFFRFYERLPAEKRKKTVVRILFRILFKLNSLIDPFFLSLGDNYKKRVSKNWTIKQKYFFFRADS